MSEFNYDILRSNIQELLNKRGITQGKLGDAIGMSQSNISQALNPNLKKHFTLDQVFAISQYFSVSIDSLLGNSSWQNSDISLRSVAELISSLIISHDIATRPLTTKEKVYEPYWSEENGPDCKITVKDITYTALYFPGYWQPDDKSNKTDLSENEYFYHYQELCDVAENCGNETKFERLNRFLEKFVTVFKLYDENKLPEDAFQTILRGYLEELPA